MQTQISKLLAELYQLDASLAQKETELIKILTEMLKNKPDAQLDDSFRKELKSKLSAEISASKNATASIPWKHIFAGFLTWGAAIGMASFLLLPSVVAPTVDETRMNSPEIGTITPSFTENTSDAVDFGFKSEKKASAAFGTLWSIATSQETPRSATLEKTAWSAPASGNSSAWVTPKAVTSELAVPTTAAPEPAPLKMWAGIRSDRMMMPIIQEQKSYVYTYSGAGYVIKDAQMSVLQKKKGAMSSDETANFLKNFKISSLDLAKFSDLQVSNITTSENHEYGLNLTIDFVEGTINLSKNWNLWPQRKCDSNGCPMTRIEDIPSDTDAIASAEKFIKNYKINTDSYGTPYVMNDWRAEYDRATDKSLVYVPDSLTVMFPLVIEWKKVYESYGQPKGMSVVIDVAAGRVSDVYGMEKLNFESSEYATETDFSKILEVVKMGGRNRYMTMPFYKDGSVTQVDVLLEEPELIYTHLYDYQNGTAKEYLVPALMFSTKQEPKAGEYFQKNIIVPIIKDFFEGTNEPMLYKQEVSR